MEQGFIEKVISKKICLTELKVRKELTGWSLDSGYIYQADFDDKDENRPIALYEIEEDGEILEKKDSKPELVQGSCYQDVAAGKVYVWCSDDGDPDGKIIIGHFWLYYADSGSKGNGSPLIFQDALYSPRLSSAGIGSISESSADIFLSQVSVGGCGLSLLNGDGHFDDMVKKYLWLNGKARVLMGGDNLPYLEYKVIFEGKIESFSINDQRVELNLKNAKADFHKTIPDKEYLLEDYPNMDEGSLGKPIALLWGEKIIKPILINYYEENGRFKCTDGSITPLSAIIWVKYDGTEIAEADLTKDLTNGEFVIKSAWSGGSNAKDNPDKVTVFIANVASGTSGTKEMQEGVGGYMGCEDTHIDKNNPTANSGASTYLRIRENPEDIQIINTLLRFDLSVLPANSKIAWVQLNLWNIDNESYTWRPKVELYKLDTEDWTEGGATWNKKNGVDDWVSGAFSEDDYSTLLVAKTLLYGKKTKQTFYSTDAFVNYIQDQFDNNKNAEMLLILHDIRFQFDQEHRFFSSEEATETGLRPQLRVGYYTGQKWRGADVVKSICISCLKQDNLDDESFDNTKNNAMQELDVFIDEEESSAEVIKRICNSIKAYFIIGPEGKIYLELWSTGAPPGTLELKNEHYLSFGTEMRLDEVFKKIKISYDRDILNNKWKTEICENAEVEQKWGIIKDMKLETYLRFKNEAENVAQYWGEKAKNETDHITLTTKLMPMNLKIGGKVKLSRMRAPSITGNYFNVICYVISIERNFAEMRTILELIRE